MNDILDRRNFLKSVGLSVALGLQKRSLVFGRSGNSVPSERPNIVFILTDDQRYDAMGCAGHPWLKTPHMDRLAGEGAMFRNAFVTTSLCSPSRGSFLTGCYAHKHEVFRNNGVDPNPAVSTFPELLQKAGYETAFIGKWHMARKNSPRPGFEHWVSFSGQGRYDKNKPNVDGQTVQSDTYVTDDLTNYAVRFLKKPREKPFMLYLSHKAVHGPFAPAKRHANLYSDVEIESRHNPKDNLDTKPPWEALEQIDALDNTVVIFAGDNGYFQGEHGGMWDKRAAYEPSMRIPLLMRYPRLVRPSTICDEMVLNIDLAPSLLELAGVPRPGTMQGQSWLGVLKGRPGRGSFLYEYFQEADRKYKRPTILAVRMKRWKYVTYPLDDSLTCELYDMLNDPEELNNLLGSSKYSDVTERMKKELEQLKRETGFRFPQQKRI